MAGVTVGWPSYEPISVKRVVCAQWICEKVRRDGAVERCGGAKGSESRLGAPVRGVNEQVTVEWDALGSGSALGQDKDLWINQPRGCCRLSFAENLLLSTES